MTPVLHGLAPFSAAAAGALVSSVWKGLLLAGCVAVLLRMMRGLTAAARSLIWTAVLLLVVAAPLLSLALQHGPAAAAEHGALLQVSEQWSVALVCLWAAASAFRAVQLATSAFLLRKTAKRAVPVEPDGHIAELLQRSPRAVELCVSADVDRPSVAGFVRPRVLLPSGLLERVSQLELEQIVLHELEHLRRRDDWTNLLQKISLVVFPLHPVLLWLDHRLCLERELACDEEVLRATRSRKTYAACLVDLAGDSLLRRGTSLALGAWERQSELARRVHRILAQPEETMNRGRMRAVTAVMIAGVTGVVGALAHGPRLISFTPAAPPVAQAETAVAPEFPAPSNIVLPRPTLVKAVIPERRQPSALPVSTARKPRRAPVARNAQERRAVPQDSWIVLTTWPGDASAHLVPALAEGPQFSYAAVPVRNGWLIVQL